MIRLTVRQFRFPAGVAFAALSAFAILLLITGRRLAHLYDSTVAGCSALGNCDVVKASFFQHYVVLWQLLGPILIIVPGLIGIFWGAPLVARELETGTFRLAWTQSVSRNRWLLVKLGIVGVTSVAIAGVLSWLVTWWASPIDKLNLDRFHPGTFDERGIVAIGYAAFAFTLGVTAGVILRRSLPAMAIALALFVAVRIVVALVVRPHYMPPVHTDMQITSGGSLGFSPSSAGITFIVGEAPSPPNAWAISSEIVDQAGHKVSQAALAQFIQTACPNLGNGPGSAAAGNATHAPADVTVFHDCVDQLSTKYHLLVTYQPANRYWTFQWIELGIFLSLALILAGLSFWWVRHRLA